MLHSLLLAVALGAPAGEGDLARAIAAVRGVGPNGQGTAAAAQAWKRLAAADVAELPALLAGMDGASPLARNWLRSAIDPVLDRAARDKKPVPAAELEGFLRDTRHDPTARRFAYELVVKAEPAAADRLLPGMLDDPSPDLRHDAVARVVDAADKLLKDDKKADAEAQFRRALAAARDFEQLDAIIKKLGELGQKVTLAEHVGFLRSWKVVGPFPNPGGKGMETVYPPEQGLDFAAEYDGKSGKVKWKEFTSKAADGVIDLNDAVGASPEGVAYAAAEFRSKDARAAEVRLGSFVGFKLWVNGELVLVRGDAYTGFDPDHYVAAVKLKPGANTILVKFAQEPPPPQLPPPNHWRFMLRVCDPTGAAIAQAPR
ncbi:MAG TPA: hypothetical protein VGF55_00995 [Gemmataceae bacterium]|jgi:hypothetical protein